MLFAQVKQEKEYKTKVWGYLVDEVTQQPVYNPKVTIIRAEDSSDTIRVQTVSGDYSGFPRSFIIFTITKPGEYIIECEADGYETAYITWSLTKLKKNESNITLDKPWYIRKARKKKDHQLGEVVVRATKVKFYTKGDTVVYNADAFELAEGSMLDALIKQLPGVELKEGGEITVQGRRVDELLLNGRDFLNSDRKVMLDNLPSYMVKNIKVFEKTDFMRELMGDTVHKNLAMDVRLKKEYSIGLIGNAEAGVGTDHRFLARLFGLRFTPNSSLTFFANANNLSDNREPGNQGDWSPLMQATGVNTHYEGGAKYQYTNTNVRYKGNIKMSHDDSKSRSYTNSENFLPSGNTFGRIFSNNNYHNTSFNTNHEIYKISKNYLGALEIRYMELSP